MGQRHNASCELCERAERWSKQIAAVLKRNELRYRNFNDFSFIGTIPKCETAGAPALWRLPDEGIGSRARVRKVGIV